MKGCKLKFKVVCVLSVASLAISAQTDAVMISVCLALWWLHTTALHVLGIPRGTAHLPRVGCRAPTAGLAGHVARAYTGAAAGLRRNHFSNNTHNSPLQKPFYLLTYCVSSSTTITCPNAGLIVSCVSFPRLTCELVFPVCARRVGRASATNLLPAWLLCHRFTRLRICRRYSSRVRPLNGGGV